MKKLIYILIFLNSSISAQNYPHDVPEYDFINYDYNYIKFFDDSSNFERFYKNLDTLMFDGENKVNIIHFGGSHIQADMWSDRVRQNFFDLIPSNNGGRGLLFPFKLAHTNNPYYYKVTYTGEWKGYRNSVYKHKSEYGLTGVTAKTRDSISSFRITFRGDDYPDYDFNRIKIFHNQRAESFCINLISDSGAIRYNNDSLGFTEFTLNKYQDTLEFEITQLDTVETEFALYGIMLETDDPGIYYHSIGVNGASVPSYLKCNLLKEHLSQVKPNLVIFSIGINDAYESDFTAKKYERNYDSLIREIMRVAPNTAILFTTNNDSYYKRKYPNKNAEIVREVMMNLAKKYGAGVWDMYGVMGGLGSVKTWEMAGLAKRDKIHLTKKGYQLVGDLLFEAIIKSYYGHLSADN